VVEGTALEMRRTCKGTVSSNLTLSARCSHIYLNILYNSRLLIFRPTFQPSKVFASQDVRR
jgi:hypothetical protein